MKYIRQLDSLRALSILTVILVHWYPKGTRLYTISAYYNAPSLFFTLSGFLITTILLKERTRADQAVISKLTAYKNFFVKRALRLFPGYFLVLAIWYFTKPGPEVINYYYFITFTANIYMYKLQAWPALAHLWSISVEEQFYVVWPWLIFFVRRQYLPYIMLLAVGLGIGFEKMAHSNYFNSILTVNCLDSFGLGALLAWLNLSHPNLLSRYFKAFSVAAALAFLILICQFYFYKFYIKDATLVAFVACWLITFFILQGDSKKYLLAFLFENPVLMRIGKVSYGIYLYHFLIPYFTYPMFSRLNHFLHFPQPVQSLDRIWMLENFMLLLIVSFISFYFFELPVQKLKVFFIKDGIKKEKAPAQNIAAPLN